MKWPLSRILLGLALAVTSAAMLVLAFPPHHLWPLIWIAFVPLLLAQYRVLPPPWAALAPAVAYGGWMGVYFTQIFGLGRGAWYMQAWPLIVAALAFVMGRGDRPFHERTGYRWFVPQGAVAWVGLEMIRSFVPALGTWAFVGYPLWAQTWLLQPLSVFGIYGLDLLIMLVNFALAQAALALCGRVTVRSGIEALAGLVVDARNRLKPRFHQIRWRGWLAATGLLLAGWIGLSLALLAAEPDMARTVRVAAVQPNLPRPAHRDTTTTQEARLAALAAGTREAAAQDAQFVVWPEMALGFDPQTTHTAELRGLAAETGAYLVIGYVLDDAAGFRNEGAVLAPDGRFLGVYGKAHPVVFFGEPRGVNAGKFPTWGTPLGPLAAIICFDLNFTGPARRVAQAGAQLIAVPSLDGPTLARIQVTQLVFRAIENRTAMVKADSAYDSAIIDPYGRILASTATPTGAAAVLAADAPLGAADAPYTRLGDWVGWLCLAGFAASIVLMPLAMRHAG
jgi:apolipoprotein N-acyltransferase